MKSKNYSYRISGMLRRLAVVLFFALAAIGLSAQNGQQGPGGPGNGPGNPGNNPVGPGNGPGNNSAPSIAPAPNPAPTPTLAPAPSFWGSPWYTGYNYSPTVVISPSISVGNSMNQGTIKVIANGYDAMGVWRVLPLLVSYQYNGVQYNVTVLNAWNPWTDQWDNGVDVQAFNTNYSLRNVTYDFYVVLSFGTFYFNL